MVVILPDASPFFLDSVALFLANLSKEEELLLSPQHQRQFPCPHQPLFFYMPLIAIEDAGGI